GALRPAAAAHGVRQPAPARAGRESGPPGARVRGPDPGGVQPDAGNPAAPDHAWGRAHARRRDRPRSGRGHSVCHRREAGRLCGRDAARPRERWEDPVRAVAPDVNRYLKWAFVEAANAICITHGRAPQRHVSRLYVRLARRKGHAKAIGAVARHLAEATFWILSKHEPYRESKASAVSSTADQRGWPLSSRRLDR